MLFTMKGKLFMGKKEIFSGVCETDIPPMESHFNAVPAVVKKLTNGFKTKDWSSHIEPIPIPSRQEVVNLIKHVQQVLFPGYFTRVVLSSANLEYYLGQKMAEIYESLALQISNAIRHDCYRHNKSCTHCGESSYEFASVFIEALPDIKKTLETDIQATLEGDPAASNADEVIFSYPGLFATMVYRIAHQLVHMGVPIIPRIMSEYAYHRTTIDINPKAHIGDGLFIDHGAGVVIGATTTIGDHVRLYQGVTLGALSLPRDAGERLRDKKRHPTIEDNVIIYANATILGGDTVIGARSIIGGNVWLTKSVGPDTKVILEQPELVYLGKKKR